MATKKPVVKKAVKKTPAKKTPAKKTTTKKSTAAKKTVNKSKVAEAVSRTLELILVRPRRDEKTRIDFHVHVKDSFNTRGYVKLGPYSENSRVEEWCHKEDVEFYKEKRQNEID